MMFKTASGSIYVINERDRTWFRTDNPDSPHLRTLKGEYIEYGPVQIGTRVVLVCPPLNEGSTHRVIFTTPVKEIL